MKRQIKRLCSYFHAIKKAVPFFLIMTQVELQFADWHENSARKKDLAGSSHS